MDGTKAGKFWRDSLADAPGWDKPNWAAMQSWTVGMFNIAMEFAEAYAKSERVAPTSKKET